MDPRVKGSQKYKYPDGTSPDKSSSSPSFGFISGNEISILITVRRADWGEF
jgi:hypothetical protein